MINFYNFSVHIISKVLSEIFFFKKVGVYNFFINLSLGNFKYSKYRIKLSNIDNHENTYRFCLGGAYGFSYSDYLKKIDSKFIFLDIGANIGLYSCIASKNLNCEYVYAFEPVKKINKIAKKNFYLNNVKGKIINFGIHTKICTKIVYFNPRHTGMTSLKKKNNNNFKSMIKCNFVNYKKINKILDDKKFFYVVKIDVEGLEMNVLNQLIKLKIFKYVQSILVEINDSKKVKQIEKKLKRYKFYNNKKFLSIFTKDFLFVKEK